MSNVSKIKINRNACNRQKIKINTNNKLRRNKSGFAGCLFFSTWGSGRAGRPELANSP